MPYTFLGDNKHDKIERNTLIADYNQGSLPWQILDHSEQPFKWAYRLTNHSLEKWKILPTYCFRIIWRKFKRFLNEFKICEILTILFISTGCKSCFLIRGGNTKTPLNFRDVRKQFIWGNHFITLSNKPIFSNNLSSARVR